MRFIRKRLAAHINMLIVRTNIGQVNSLRVLKNKSAFYFFRGKWECKSNHHLKMGKKKVKVLINKTVHRTP